VATVRNVVALAETSYQQKTLLNFPRSTARMCGVEIIAGPEACVWQMWRAVSAYHDGLHGFVRRQKWASWNGERGLGHVNYEYLEPEAVMPPTLQQLGLDHLSFDDRIAVAQALWDSLPAFPRSPLTQAQQEELTRRAAEDDARPDDVIAWDTVRAGILARLDRS
jgi:putative addiction module component (TIGR02574 family)